MSKINVLITGAGNFGRGGVSTVIWNLCENFTGADICVDFFTDKVSAPEYLEKAESTGMKIFLTGKKKNKLADWANKYRLFNDVLKSRQYSCVHINVSKSLGAFAYSFIAKRHNVRVIIHSHSADIDSVKLQNIKRVVHYMLKHFTDFTNASLAACSDSAARWMFPKKIIENHRYKVIRNGIYTDRFVFNADVRSRIRRELDIDGKFAIGHIGRFAYPKNQSFLIDVFYELHNKNSNSVLIFAGNGADEKMLREKVHKLRIEESVIFYGVAEKTEELYCAMDCFVFPSVFEGLGIVAIEAQASGLRVLCSDGVPVEAKVTDLLEFMSLSQPAAEWAERILSYDSGYKRMDMSEKIKAAGYDIKQSAKELEEIYLECTGQQKNSVSE